MPDPHRTPCGAGNLRILPVGPTPGPLARGAFPAAADTARHLALPAPLEALVAELSRLPPGQLQLVIPEALRRRNQGPLWAPNLLWQMAMDAEVAG